MKFNNMTLSIMITGLYFFFAISTYTLQSVNAQSFINHDNNTIYLPIVISKSNSAQSAIKAVYIAPDINASSTGVDGQLLAEEMEDIQDIGIGIVSSNNIQGHLKVNNASIIYLAPSLIQTIDSSMLNSWKKQNKMLVAMGTSMNTLKKSLKIDVDQEMFVSANQKDEMENISLFMSFEHSQEVISGTFASTIMYTELDWKYLHTLLTRQTHLIYNYQTTPIKHMDTQVMASTTPNSLGYRDVRGFSDSWGNSGVGQSWIDDGGSMMNIEFYDGYSRTDFQVAANYQYLYTQTWTNCSHWHSISSVMVHGHGVHSVASPAITAGSNQQCRPYLEVKGHRAVRTYPVSYPPPPGKPNSIGITTVGHYQVR